MSTLKSEDGGPKQKASGFLTEGSVQTSEHAFLNPVAKRFIYMFMNRRRSNHTPIPSPLIGQGFPPHQATRAVIHVVREVHEAHYELDSREVEDTIQEAIERARRERGKDGKS